MLFDAAYACALRHVAGAEAATDAELDAQVRAVLVLSGDFNPPEIARATGFSEATGGADPRGLPARRQIPGERGAGGGGGTEGGGEVVRQQPAVAPETVELVRQMWADGRTVREIGAAIGKNDTAVSVWMVKHRDVCPKRFPERATAGPGHEAGAVRRAVGAASPARA